MQSIIPILSMLLGLLVGYLLQRAGQYSDRALKVRACMRASYCFATQLKAVLHNCLKCLDAPINARSVKVAPVALEQINVLQDWCRQYDPETSLDYLWVKQAILSLNTISDKLNVLLKEEQGEGANQARIDRDINSSYEMYKSYAKNSSQQLDIIRDRTKRHVPLSARRRIDSSCRVTTHQDDWVEYVKKRSNESIEKTK